MALSYSLTENLLLPKIFMDLTIKLFFIPYPQYSLISKDKKLKYRQSVFLNL